jgi:hypothetical protein
MAIHSPSLSQSSAASVAAFASYFYSDPGAISVYRLAPPSRPLVQEVAGAGQS